MLAAGELRAASEYLRHEYPGPSDFTDGYRTWNLAQQSYIEHLRNNRDAGRAALRSAITLAELNRRFNPEFCTLSEQLATSLFHDGLSDEAHVAINRALNRVPTNASSWYLKGLIHWDAGEVTTAYAALATALANKGSRLDILYVRAQMYTEWWRFADADADITELLVTSRLLPEQAICLHAAQTVAKTLGQKPSIFLVNPSKQSRWKENVAQAFADLADRSKTPDNPWPYYFHALCLERYYMDICEVLRIWSSSKRYPLDDSRAVLRETRHELRSALTKAMEHDNRLLNRYRVKQITDWLERLDGHEDAGKLNSDIMEKVV
jgi:tetratricopeptide (TPR) repeat protein